MNRSLLIIFLVLISAGAFATGQPDLTPIQAEPVIVAEELNQNNPSVINIIETYPDENIYNAIGRNTVRSGQPEAIYTVFDELRRTYDPIIVYWEFAPLGGSTTGTDSDTETTPNLSQELINFSRDHIGLKERYEILETYDSTMSSIIIIVECQQSRNEVTDKVSMTTYNLNYKLVTPTDQIVIGKSNATIVKENFYDIQEMKIGEKILVDVWY